MMPSTSAKAGSRSGISRITCAGLPTAIELAGMSVDVELLCNVFYDNNWFFLCDLRTLRDICYLLGGVG